MISVPKISFELAITHGTRIITENSHGDKVLVNAAPIARFVNAPLSHLTLDEAEEAQDVHQWAVEFAVHPYKCHTQNGSLQSCKPTLYSWLTQTEIQRHLCMASQPQRALSPTQLNDVVAQVDAEPRRGDFIGSVALSPFDDALWYAVKKGLTEAIAKARDNGWININGSLVCVQADNRPVGRGNNWNEHSSFRILHNFNNTIGAQLGLFIRFHTDRSPFSNYSPFWVSTLILSFVVGIFKEADVMYMDSDLCMFPTSFAPRSLERPRHDTVHTASDVNSPINAGFIYVLRGIDVSHRTVMPGLDASCWESRRFT